MKTQTENLILIEILNRGTDFLTKKSVESARLVVELLLCDVLNLKRIDLYLNYQLPLKAVEIDLMREHLKRAGRNEPIQYITGKANFNGIDLNVNNNVLIPRPETEQMASEALEIISARYQSPKILDIGTGSGCIAIFLAKKLPNSHITAIDVSESALEVARENAQINQINNIDFQNIDITRFTDLGKFDVIISNPPYICEEDYKNLDFNVKEFEPKIALLAKNNGLEFFIQIIEIIDNCLNMGGFFFLETSKNQQKSVTKLMKKALYTMETKQDIFLVNRFVYGQKIDKEIEENLLI